MISTKKLLFVIPLHHISFTSGKSGSGSLAGLVFLSVNKDESKMGLTVFKLKLNKEIEEAFAI